MVKRLNVVKQHVGCVSCALTKLTNQFMQENKMSPQQQILVEAIIDQKGRWINAEKLEEITGVKRYNIFKILGELKLPNLKKDKVKMNGIRTAFLAWKWSEEDNYAGQALRLAKQNPGIWGQLFWSSK